MNSTIVKILIATFAVLALIAGASWYFLVSHTSSSDLSIELSHADEIRVGEPFAVDVNLNNSSDRTLTNVDVALSLPPGIVLVGSERKEAIVIRSLQDIKPESATKEEIMLVALQDPQSVKQLSVKVTYHSPTDPRATFEVRATSELRLGTAALPISFSFPEKAIVNEQFPFTIKYKNESGHQYSDLILRLTYPSSFKISETDPAIEEEPAEWHIPSLKQGEEGTITVRGSISNTTQSYGNFEARLFVTLDGTQYPVSVEPATLKIAPSPLQLSVTANGSNTYISKIDDNLSYSIRYKNTLTTPLENVTISAALRGELFDMSSLISNGSLNSITNTVAWNAASAPQLAVVQGGQEGVVTFTVKLKKEFPITRVGDKNYTLNVHAEGESSTVPPGSNASKVSSKADLETKVQGAVVLSSTAYHQDPTSGIVNSGPYPPRVNQPTQYTVHWTIKNYATNVSGVTVKALLQSGAKFVKVVKVSDGAGTITTNQASGEIRWNVGFIPATKGVISSPVEVIFQIEHTPAVNQVGQHATLLTGPLLEAHDDFTGGTHSVSVGITTTEIPDDKSLDVTQPRSIQQ